MVLSVGGTFWTNPGGRRGGGWACDVQTTVLMVCERATEKGVRNRELRLDAVLAGDRVARGCVGGFWVHLSVLTLTKDHVCRRKSLICRHRWRHQL